MGRLQGELQEAFKMHATKKSLCEARENVRTAMAGVIAGGEIGSVYILPGGTPRATTNSIRELEHAIEDCRSFGVRECELAEAERILLAKKKKIFARQNLRSAVGSCHAAMGSFHAADVEQLETAILDGRAACLEPSDMDEAEKILAKLKVQAETGRAPFQIKIPDKINVEM